MVFLPSGTGGLQEDCAAICHQITTLDRAKLTQRIGRLPEAMMRSIEAGIRAAIALDSTES